jgi:hypothetical protein
MLAGVSANVTPSPYEAPVTSAVFPFNENSKSAVMMSSVLRDMAEDARVTKLNVRNDCAQNRSARTIVQQIHAARFWHLTMLGWRRYEGE